MAGKGSSLDRILAMAQKGPAKKRPAEASPPQQEPANNPQAVVVAGSEGTRPKGKEKRAKGGEADKGAVDTEGPSQVKPSTPVEEPQRKPAPSWLDHLSEAAYGDPLQACKEICQQASERLKQALVLRKDKEEASRRVKELEKALKVANEKTVSSDKELQLAQEELQSTKEELQSTKEEIQKTNGLEKKISEIQDEVKELTADKESLEEENERLRSDLDITAEDATNVLEESFRNALQQVQLCHPELSIDRSIVHHHDVVLGDQIERRKPDGSSTLIYKDPAVP